MLVVMDVGNTNTVIGVYQNDQLLSDWRIRTEKEATIDELGILLRNLFQAQGLALEPGTELIISSVVPPMNNTLEGFAQRYLKVRPLWVGPGIKTGMPIYYDNPREVGADRIVNAVAAFEQVHGAVVIVDFGTATTFDVVSHQGEYQGGVIAPGVMISCEALFLKASKLPRVELVKPKHAVGKNTVHSMQAGIIFGYVGLVDEIVRRMKEEVGTNPKVIATGGLAEVGGLTGSGWLALVFLGVFCSGLAYVFWYDALRVLPTARVGMSGIPLHYSRAAGQASDCWRQRDSVAAHALADSAPLDFPPCPAFRGQRSSARGRLRCLRRGRFSRAVSCGSQARHCLSEARYGPGRLCGKAPGADR